MYCSIIEEAKNSDFPRKHMVLGWLMYYKCDRDPLGIDAFFLPFSGKLNKDNRWVCMAESMP